MLLPFRHFGWLLMNTLYLCLCVLVVFSYGPVVLVLATMLSLSRAAFDLVVAAALFHALWLRMLCSLPVVAVKEKLLVLWLVLDEIEVCWLRRIGCRLTQLAQEFGSLVHQPGNTGCHSLKLKSQD